MNGTRLFVLGVLARGGPMHGHQIRRTAQVDRMDLWSDVKPGSLYGALHRMVAENVIEVLRTEQEGSFPARTVYQITDSGRAELTAHRDEALRTVRMKPDPVDLALQHTYDLSEERLRSAISERKLELETTLASWRQLREVADPHIRGLERMTFRHTELRLLAELEWHAELLASLPELLAEGPVEPPPDEEAAERAEGTGRTETAGRTGGSAKSNGSGPKSRPSGRRPSGRRPRSAT